jgi:HAD superfamily hydrolase (TIGR01509 family)
MDISSIRQIKKEVQLHTFFDAIYFSRDYKIGKVEAPVMQHMLKKYQCSPSEIVLIDDEKRNFTQLTKEGYQTIVYT